MTRDIVGVQECAFEDELVTDEELAIEMGLIPDPAEEEYSRESDDQWEEYRDEPVGTATVEGVCSESPHFWEDESYHPEVAGDLEKAKQTLRDRHTAEHPDCPGHVEFDR